MSNLGYNLDSKDKFIRALAERAGYTYKDTEHFWDCFTDLIEDVVAMDGCIRIRRFGELYLSHIPARTGYDGIRKEHIEIGPSKKLHFKFSDRYRQIVRKMGKMNRGF